MNKSVEGAFEFGVNVDGDGKSSERLDLATNPNKNAPVHLASSSTVNLERLFVAARSRVLTTEEALYMLENHRPWHVARDIPYKPPSGSLLIFEKDRHRHFRDDGYSWRTDDNGKLYESRSILMHNRNAVIKFRCAKRLDNPNFCRRCYYPNVPKSNIVLVHYMEEPGAPIEAPVQAPVEAPVQEWETYLNYPEP